MHRNRFYLIMIIAAVLCASVCFCFEHQDRLHEYVKTASKQPEAKSSAIFPDPGQTSYKMQLYLDVQTHTLYGSTWLKTKNTSGKSIRALWFTVYPNCFRDPMTSPAPPEAYYAGFNEGRLGFDSFKVNDAAAEVSGQGSSLRVKPASLLLPDQEMIIEMKWKVTIPKLKYRFGRTETTYMLGNFYPALNVLSQAGWHNAYNSRFGDPFCFQSADYQVVLNIPAGYNFVSSGKTVDSLAEDNGREIHLIDAENARDFCLLVMYDYTEIEEKIKNTTIKCSFPGERNQTAERLLKQSMQILDYYASKFGAYPYEEFKVVAVPMQGFHGMEYSGMILLQEEMLQAAAEQQRSRFILAHEIAHQWWYGLVGNDQLKEPWLDEGLANWSAYQYLHEMQGQNLPSANQSNQKTNLNKGLAEIDTKQEYYLTAYRGGEAFWFGLEAQIGHDQVIKALRHYLAQYQYKIATTDDLKKIIKTDTDENMDAFFKQWFASE